MRSIITRLIIVFVYLYASALSGQVPTDGPGQGIIAFSTHGASPDNINLANLHLFLKIPLFSKPSRGGVLNLGYSLVLDQPAILPQPDVNLYVPYDPVHQWQVVPDFPLATMDEPYVEYNPCGGYGPDQAISASSYRITDPGGVVRSFNLTYSDSSGCGYGGYSWSGDGLAQDGSGYHLIHTGSHYTDVNLLYPSGVIQETPLTGGNLSDANGNQLSGSTDAGGTTVSTVGSAGGVDYQYHDASGALQSTHIGYATLTVQVVDHRGSSYPPVIYAHAVGLPVSVTYADGSKYSIDYEPVVGGAAGAVTGRIHSVTLPTGGIITYSYEGDLGQSFTLSGSNTYTNFDPRILRRRFSTDNADWLYTSVGQGGDSYNNAYSSTTIRSPEGNDTVVTFAGLAPYLYETARTVYQGSGTDRTSLQSSTRCYNNADGNCHIPLPGTAIAQTDDSVTPTGMLTSRTIAYYDANGQTTGADEYGSASSPVRKKRTIFGTRGSSPHLIQDRPSTSGVQNSSGNWASKTDYIYDALGNPTDEYRDVDGSSSLHLHRDYDVHGMPVTVIAPRGVSATKIVYEASGTFPQSIETTHSDNSHVNGKVQATLYDYDVNTGLLRSSTDPNGISTTRTYDSVGRLTSTKVGLVTDGSTSVETQACFHPFGVATPPGRCSGMANSVLRSTARASNQWLQTEQLYDGAGRQIAVNDWSRGTHEDFSYYSDGSLHTQSNPYYAISDSTAGTATYSYDALRRRVAEDNQDGTRRTWCYNHQGLIAQWCSPVSSVSASSTADAVDEAGRKTQSQYDGLGNLTGVVEDVGGMNVPTSYSYDLLSNLTDVSSVGIGSESPRNRHFSYDRLSRLIASRNPESGGGHACTGALGTDWGHCYAYDANSNLTSETEARGATTSYDYDALNRVIKKSYNGSENTYYTYDGTFPAGIPGSQFSGNSPNQIGRLSFARALTPTGAQAQDRYYGYDALGRLKHLSEAAPSEWGSAIHSTDVTYDLAGNTASVTYPDGRAITNGYDSAGRLNSVASGATSYLSALTYYPDGSSANLTYGNGVVETISKNSRLQTCEDRVALGSTPYIDRQYFFGTNNASGNLCNPVAGNNGNIWNIVDGLGGSYTQSFSYDALNRIRSWTAPNMAGAYRHLDYAYDSFGNMAQSLVGPNVDLSGVFTAKNQFIPGWINCTGKNGETGGYDAAGNMLCTDNQNVDAKAYVWDAEERVSQVWRQQNNNTYYPGAVYSYDGEGKRIRSDQYAFGTNTIQGWREYSYFNGQMLAEHDNTGAWTDYVYANGKKIARASAQETVLQMSGTYSGGWSATGYTVGAPSMQGYVFRTGDVLLVRQRKYGSNVHGGILIFGDGTGSYFYDQDGQRADDDLLGDGVWHNRRIPLDGLQGKTYTSLSMGGGFSTDYTFQFASVAVMSADGSVRTIFNGEAEALTSSGGPPNGAGTMAAVPADANSTHYYVGDQVGTTQMELSAAGAPLWKGEFGPFGQELDIQATTNRYKFTGKERDSESGLDYFGARYYASSMGRFMSPDTYGGRLADPQSLNKYAYARNNPLIYVDPDGHDFNLTGCGKDSSTCSNNMVGTTSPDANGKSSFTATVISNGANGLQDQAGNAYSGSVTSAGVSFSQNGSNTSYGGSWINGSNDTSFSQTGGALNGFSFNFSQPNTATGQTLAGTFSYGDNMSASQAGKALEAAGFSHSYFDAIANPLHGYDVTHYRGGGDPNTGAGAAHFILDDPYKVDDGFVMGPVRAGDFHFGETDPRVSPVQHIMHDVIPSFFSPH